jgi:hypothetical protein
MKYSNFTGVLAWSGGVIPLRKGQSIDEEHPLLKERPELFEDGQETADVSNRTNAQAPGQPRIETTSTQGAGGVRAENGAPGRVRKVAGQ